MVSAGIYIINTSILEFLNKNQFCDMPSLVSLVKQNKQRVITFPIHEYWIDVGRPETLRKANQEFQVN